MNSHSVQSEYLRAPEISPQLLFEDVASHAVAEDARGYQALAAEIIRNMLTTDWVPDIANLTSPATMRRAGYLIEFAARKILHDRRKKQTLFALADRLRTATANTPQTVLFPNPERYEYSVERNSDQLARDWGILDNVARSDILKMLRD